MIKEDAFREVIRKMIKDELTEASRPNIETIKKKGGEFYADLDSDSNLWTVFDTEFGDYGWGSFSGKNQAEKKADDMNKSNKLGKYKVKKEECNMSKYKDDELEESSSKKIPQEIKDLYAGYKRAKGSVEKRLYKDKLLDLIKHYNLKPDDVFVETSSVSGMAGGDGYMTPGAFSKPGEDQKKKRALKGNDWEIVGEARINLKDKKITPQHRLNKAVGYARKQMNEVEKVVDRAVKFRNESEMSTDIYWQRTHSSLKKLAEQLVRISHKLNYFK